ncbi:PREDICTED: uncharacterized protein LOC107191892 [Dufourea novaeangliae]|uniref:uncharacterized protein LOC107191892 n=1 Tax=Dufourea novaeangliae TaxID=178035 RepID=UPI000767683D|nr:PREDICTED: uncharacterized protein LOC107191892 [Dufourea novaeangliae]
MENQARGRKDIATNEYDVYELRRLREKAKIASIFHGNRKKFQRNPHLSHVVHACLNISQVLICLSIEVFHHTHHYANKQRRKKNVSVPHLPEERNPLFYMYPICTALSTVFAILWLFTTIFFRRPLIALIGSFVGALFMILLGIMEMKHADIYLDLTKITDDELLQHPIFIHNFVMCLLSIACMIMYLIQGWVLFDYYQSIKEQTSGDVSSDSSASSESSTNTDRSSSLQMEEQNAQISDSSANTDVSEVSEDRPKIGKRKRQLKEEVGELELIPALDRFPSLSSISQSVTVSIEDEPVILYCCLIDCYNYIKHQHNMKQTVHEFQVIHVM